jgi:hypothetical protein
MGTRSQTTSSARTGNLHQNLHQPAGRRADDTYEPTQLNGEPVEVEIAITVTVTFTLH